MTPAEAFYFNRGEPVVIRGIAVVGALGLQRVDEVTRALVEEHPHDVPEVIALKVKGGHAPYLSRVADASKGE